MQVSKKNFSITLICKDLRLKSFYEEKIWEVLGEKCLSDGISLGCTLSAGALSVKVVTKSAPHALKFLLEFMTRWLVPSERLKTSHVFSVDFLCEEQLFSLTEIDLDLPKSLTEAAVYERFLALEEEVKLGLSSEREARRIMEIKGVTFEEKALFVQDELSWLINRFSGTLSQEILQEFQHMLVLSPEIFKEERTSRHLCRLVVYEHLFKKWLTQSATAAKEWRVKVFRAVLKGDRPILGIFVGVNHLDGSEIFDEKHLLQAVQHYLPDAKLVEGSTFSSRRGKSPIATFYLEVERGTRFSNQEVSVLRRVLTDDLKGRVEPLMQPLFMPSNEEELMRNTMILSNQIKFTRDVPQLIITFQEQRARDLLFLIVLVRVKGPENPPIEELSIRLSEKFLCTLDRCKTIGVLRKKYTKEAASLSVCLPKEQFFRKDNSIDLYRARQAVVDEFHNVLGEFRDYNGGMISKQNELLKAFRAELGEVDELFVDNFFFSLMPVVMRTVLDPISLKTLYQLVVEAISAAPYRNERHEVVFKIEPKQIFACVTADDAGAFEEVQRSFEGFDFHPTELAFIPLNVGGSHISGFLYRTDDPAKQSKFCALLQRGAVEVDHAVTI